MLYTVSLIPEDKKGGSIGTGENLYTWDNCYWASAIGSKARVAARFGGIAAYGHCSPRYLLANYAASNTSRTHCGLAQLLLDVSQPQV